MKTRAREPRRAHAAGRARGQRRRGRRDPRQERADPRRVEADRRGVDDARARAHHRRVGHRQGAGRARDPRRVGTSATGRSSPSTAPRSRPACSRASCSVTSRARSPARSPIGPAASSSPARARCSSTRSPRSRSTSRRSCCACCRSARSSASAMRRPMPLEARVIAATHRDLAAMVAQGHVPRGPATTGCASSRSRLPPLRERASDIPMLVEGLLAKINRDLGKDVRVRHAGRAREARRRTRGPATCASSRTR